MIPVLALASFYLFSFIERFNDQFGYRGVQVKKLNLHEVYSFGKILNPLLNIKKDSKLKPNIYILWFARNAAEAMMRDDSPLLGTARRAVGKLITAINETIPTDFDTMMKIGDEEIISWYPVSKITTALNELESVLGNDMPGIAAYLVSKKGIFDTEDLIEHAENYLLPDIRGGLPEQAKVDLREAGKCLAYELATACAFHLWRAVEMVMEAYYLRLTGKTLKHAGIASNWGAYIKALEKAGADAKVTVFLDHIRDKYRNPHTHPDVVLTTGEAQGLFGVAMSSIDQMVTETKRLPEKTTPAISVIPASTSGKPHSTN